MNRRGFLGSLAALVAVPLVPKVKLAPVDYSHVDFGYSTPVTAAELEPQLGMLVFKEDRIIGVYAGKGHIVRYSGEA